MNAATYAILDDNLKFLKLSSMRKNFKDINRQALESKASYMEFLLNLTDEDVKLRKENGRKRRIREASFPLHKPLSTYDFDLATDLDIRFFNDLANGSYLKENKNVTFQKHSTCER